MRTKASKGRIKHQFLWLHTWKTQFLIISYILLYLPTYMYSLALTFNYLKLIFIHYYPCESGVWLKLILERKTNRLTFVLHLTQHHLVLSNVYTYFARHVMKTCIFPRINYCQWFSIAEEGPIYVWFSSSWLLKKGFVRMWYEKKCSVTVS